jgi:NAD(P)-dependent dehydrogenase (short-subunit alcohol dehydrogenase family)
MNGADAPKTEVVLVTGSSSGIGKACCDHLAKGTRRIYGASRTTLTGAGWHSLSMDVRDEASVQTVVDEISRREGRLDAVVHCAGISLAGPFEYTTVEEAISQFETNYFGTVRVVRAIIPVMRKQGTGKVLIIGSIGGLIGLPYVCHYSASKFALDGLTQALRLEIAPLGIQATVIHPGDLNTHLGANQVYCRNNQTGSSDFATFNRVIGLYDANMKKARSPIVVAHEVERLLSRRRLPPRRVIGTPVELLGVWLQTILPAASFEYILRKSYGL